MFIQEKYLITANSAGAAEGISGHSASILTCKYCKNEFMVPSEEASKLDVIDVCEATECVKAHEKESMAVKMAEIKNEVGGIVKDLNNNLTEEINKALGI